MNHHNNYDINETIAFLQLSYDDILKFESCQQPLKWTRDVDRQFHPLQMAWEQGKTSSFAHTGDTADGNQPILQCNPSDKTP